jgi:hypothetical protein
MNPSVAVTTAPRAVGYLEATLDSLTKAGFQSVEVVEDDGGGINATYKRAMRLALESQADSILICQDDIEVARGLANWLTTLEWPANNVGCLSLYCAQPYRQDDVGWWEFPLQPTRIMRQPWAKVYGALAMLWPRESAERFVTDKPPFDGRSKVDQLIGKWCMDSGRSLWVHSPSLVEHIGAVSTCGGHNTLTPSRQAGQWCHDVAALRRESGFHGNLGQLEATAQPSRHSGQPVR